MISRLNSQEKQPSIFYFHPWELDPDQPRIGNVDLKTRFRHYNNLRHMQTKLSRLLEEFSWGSMQEIFVDNQAMPLPVKTRDPIMTASV
jgi:hypothetical protein